jgi:hypothetical protein
VDARRSGSVAYIASVTIACYNEDSHTRFYDTNPSLDKVNSSSSVESVGTATPIDTITDTLSPSSYIIVNTSHATALVGCDADESETTRSSIPASTCVSNGWIVDADSQSTLSIVYHFETPKATSLFPEWSRLGSGSLVRDVLRQYYAMRFLRMGVLSFGERLTRSGSLAEKKEGGELPVHFRMVERLKKACKLFPLDK